MTHRVVWYLDTNVSMETAASENYLYFIWWQEPPPPPQTKRGSGGLLHSSHRNKKKIVGMMMSNVARDLTFSRNQPMKLADAPYIGILKNTLNLGSLRWTKTRALHLVV